MPKSRVGEQTIIDKAYIIARLDFIYWFKDFVDSDHRQEFIDLVEKLETVIKGGNLE